MDIPLYDTQLVSYAMNGTYSLPTSGIAISSTTAQELLLMQSSNPTRNSYYVPRLPPRASVYGIADHMRRMPHGSQRPAWKRMTDRLILDFGRDYPTVVEYSHQALAGALNHGAYDLLEAVARSIEPSRHRVAVRRLRYLIEHNVHCVALSHSSAEAGLELFHAFAANFTLKQNFRNSLNDILTLAVAQTSSSVLHTSDGLLTRFAATQSQVPVNLTNGQISIDFSATGPTRRESRGTKGYVNHGWRVRR